MDGETLPALATMPAISRQIWDMKYRLREAGEDGNPGAPLDLTVEDTWRRVANTLAEPEPKDKGMWADRFYEALSGFKFLPGGRIIAGAGSGRKVTLSNCFVMGTIPDDMGGIFAHLREAALTMQQGGGIGYDFSTLRPKGAPVHGVGADASGPLTFMDVWDAMCRTVESAGYRRGAMMATLRCDHPDIEAFVEAKADKSRLRMFNMSVLVTDAFMLAVEQDREWPLCFDGRVFKTIRAADLWNRIMRATYAYAEPGVIFIDRLNGRNNLYYCEKMAATNPCGEVPLPPYGNCLLGSLNIAALVEEPFSNHSWIDTERLRWHVETAVRMLDNVIEVSGYPLPVQRKEALDKRRIGLGITGLGDALIMLGLRYGSTAAVSWTGAVIAEIQTAAYQTSIGLAAEKGAFPLFDRDKYLAGEHVKTLPAEVIEGIARHGMRNSHLMSIAPTGTISLLAGNVSGGIEPVFSLAPHTRKLLMPDGSREEHEIADYAYALWRQQKGDAPLPDYFVDAQTLDPADHLIMQAVVQKYVDAAISKTINLPADIPFEQFKDVYAEAYRSDCKSCTTYRPNEVTGSVLAVKQAEPAPAKAEVYESVVQLTPPLASPDEVEGTRYRIRWPDSDHSLYVILTDILEPSGRRRPWEVFLISNESDSDEWRVALGRMISAVYRRGGDVAFIAAELKVIADKKGGAWLRGKRVPSIIAEIGNVIEKHMVKIGFLPPKEAAVEAVPIASTLGGVGANIAPAGSPRLRQCPKCGETTLIRQEGCDQCTACAYSRCG